MRRGDRDRLRAGAVLAGVVGGLFSGATGDYVDAASSRSRVLPADYAFGIWAPDLRRVPGLRRRRAAAGTPAGAFAAPHGLARRRGAYARLLATAVRTLPDSRLAGPAAVVAAASVARAAARAEAAPAAAR